MARKIPFIRQFLIDTLVSKAAAIGISINPNKWSKYDYKSLILDTVATGQGIEEQLWDQCKIDINNIVSVAAPETNSWFENQIKNKFQFNSATPQLVQILPPTFEPKYSINNDSYKVVKYCTVVSGLNGITKIKAAADVGGLPADIDTVYGAGTLDTLVSFVNTISNPCIKKIVSSGNADRLWMQLDVYYNGLYAAVIQSNVIAGINNYLKSLTPNGTLQGTVIYTDLLKAIKAVQGVNDVTIVNMRGRNDATAFPGGSSLVNSNTIIGRLYNTFAGYIVLEDTIGNTLIDPRPSLPTINNLNLIPQS